MTKTLVILKYVIYTLEILVFFVIEQTPYLFTTEQGAKPVCIVAIAISIAVLEKGYVGMVYGIIAGVFMDSVSGEVFGFYTLVLALLCFIVSFLVTEKIKANTLTCFLFTIACVFAVFSLQFFFFYYLRGYENASYVYVTRYLPTILFTVLLSPLFYLFNRLLKSTLVEKKKKWENK